MKPNKLILAALLVLAAGAGSISQSAAEGTPPTPVIAVLDIQVILRDSKAMKAVRDQIEEQRKKFQAEITEQEKKLRADSQALEKQRSVLSPEAFAKRQRELQDKVVEVRGQVEARRRQLDQAFSEAAKTFRETLVKLVEGVAKQKGYNMVFARAQIVHAAPQFDITDQALKLLNRRLPTLKVNVPSQ